MTHAAPQATRRELVLTRMFDAPRELVFTAWTDPQHVARWWGPRGFDSVVTEWDARPGGAIHLDMRGHGASHPMRGRFVEIQAPTRLVFTALAFEEANGEYGLENLNTVTFEEVGRRTRVTLHVVVQKASPAATEPLAGMEEGWSQSLDRLDDQVVEATWHGGDREITAHRLFHAPRALMWKMWTEPQHIAQWWGPKGFTNTTKSMDVQPGGAWEHVMHGPDGRDFPNLVRYIEIKAPELIVYAHESEPRFEVTVTFSEQVGKTRITMRMRFATAAVRHETAQKFGAVEGMQETLGRLEGYLGKVGAT
jgi:uncharacterized protein YndB with AHSA1/START domain